MATTLKDVARAAGVSVATASYALSGRGSVGDATRRRVIEVADELRYQPNLSAKAMRTGRTGTIGLILPDLTNPFFPTLVQNVVVAAREVGLGVFVTDSQGSKETERRIAAGLIRHGVDGLVWFPVTDEDTVGEILAEVPTVVLDRDLPGFDSVTADFEQGGRLAARTLTEAGHQKIGVISGPQGASSSRRRTRTIVDEVQSEATLVWHVTNAYSTDLEPKVIDRLREGRVTGVIAGNDLIAVGAMKELGEAGVAVPEDMSIVSFDNTPLCEIVSPPLSSINVPGEEMGVEALRMLARRIENPREPRRRTMYDVELVARGSVRVLS